MDRLFAIFRALRSAPYLHCLVAVLVIAVLLWLIHAMRLRTVANRIRGRAAERLDEREGIARDLHDTLLQSVQALTLRFQLAIDYLPKEEPARSVLEAAIDQADHLIAEGRDRVRDLSSFEDGDIEQILCDIVARQAFEPDVAVAITHAGTASPLDPPARDEIIRIASEALFNIRHHAQASRIAIVIGYGKAFSLRFADNGVGIVADVATRGERKGHSDLPDMRERARKLRGALTIRARAEGGTELLLTVPGRIAYKGDERRLFDRYRSLGDAS